MLYYLWNNIIKYILKKEINYLALILAYLRVAIHTSIS